MNPGEPRVGLIVTATRFDKKIGRSRCGACRRVLITGQSACVCGARFQGTVSA